MPFVNEPQNTYSDSETRKRTSAQYVKFNEDYRVVLRMLNDQARLVWKHWIGEANAGKGMMANCPNVSSQVRPCPIEKEIAGLPNTDTKYQERRAKKRYIVNVLDRTPYTVCNHCNEDVPKSPKCTNCGADISKQEFAPLNKVKLLEGGPRLFVEQLAAIEKLQTEDYPKADITDYDIVFTTNGSGRDRKIACIPQAPKLDDDGNAIPTPEEWLDDPENPGEKQKLFDLDRLSEPSPLEEIEAMLRGATIDELNALRGIE